MQHGKEKQKGGTNWDKEPDGGRDKNNGGGYYHYYLYKELQLRKLGGWESYIANSYRMGRRV